MKTKTYIGSGGPISLSIRLAPACDDKIAAAMRRVAELKAQLAAMQAQRDKAVFALQGLLEDITDYQTINNLGGENNHWQVIARAVLKECGK